MLPQYYMIILLNILQKIAILMNFKKEFNPEQELNYTENK